MKKILLYTLLLLALPFSVRVWACEYITYHIVIDTTVDTLTWYLYCQTPAKDKDEFGYITWELDGDTTIIYTYDTTIDTNYIHEIVTPKSNAVQFTRGPSKGIFAYGKMPDTTKTILPIDTMGLSYVNGFNKEIAEALDSLPPHPFFEVNKIDTSRGADVLDKWGRTPFEAYVDEVWAMDWTIGWVPDCKALTYYYEHTIKPEEMVGDTIQAETWPDALPADTGVGDSTYPYIEWVEPEPIESTKTQVWLTPAEMKVFRRWLKYQAKQFGMEKGGNNEI